MYLEIIIFYIVIDLDDLKLYIKCTIYRIDNNFILLYVLLYYYYCI